MTDRELMQMASDALQKIYIAPEHEEYIRVWWPACEEAIEALRDRLAQPKPEPVAGLLETIELIGSHSEEYEAGFWDGLRAFEAKLKEKNT